MAYVGPEDLSTILKGIKNARTKYTRGYGHRLEVLDIQDAIVELIEELQPAASVTEDELKKIAIGSLALFIAEMENEEKYKKGWVSIEYSPGRFFSSGSQLRQLFIEILNISPENIMTEQEKLGFITKFSSAIFTEYANKFTQKIEAINLSKAPSEKKIDLSFFQDMVKDNIRNLWPKNIIPTETAIDTMIDLEKNYLSNINEKTEKCLPNEKDLLKLAVVLCKITPQQANANDSEKILSRTQRNKMGFLMYIMQFMRKQKPKGRFLAHELIGDVLNAKEPEDIDPYIRLACLSATKNYLEDNGIRQKFDSELNEYSDLILNPICKNIKSMIAALTPSPSSGLSPFVIGLGVLGGLIAEAPGYGAGYALGYGFSQTNLGFGLKYKFTAVTNVAMNVIFSPTGAHFSYHAAQLVVDPAIEYAFSTVFKSLAVLIGGSAGALVGLVIEDFSEKTLSSLSSLCAHLKSKCDPALAKNMSPEFIETLLKLPEEVFPREQKAMVKKVTKGMGLFDHLPVQKQVQEMPLEQANQLNYRLLGSSH